MIARRAGCPACGYGGLVASPSQAFFDAANQLLDQVPARMDTGTIVTADGQARGVVTVRTASTTVSVILDGPDVATWAAVLTELAGLLGGGRPPAAGLSVASPLDARMLGLNGNPKN